MDGRAQISAYLTKKIERNPSSQREFVATQKGGKGALASDDSMRFGTATRADTSVEEVEGGAARGRSENRQKLSALTSSE